MNKQVIVSACIITYNHEPFIRECLEGVIKQVVDFPYEIIISDDKSTDKTVAICKEYAEKHPGLINLIASEINAGMANNFCNAINICTGKYIAFCEGDDYWTDPLKLQKQIAFLEANPAYAFCYHHVKVIQEDGFSNQKLEMKTKQPDTSTIAEILKLNIWAHLNSIVYRRDRILNCPDWLIECPSLDWALLTIITGDKKIKYIDETMSAYRQHSSGIWSRNTKIQNQINILNTAIILKKHIVKKKDKKNIYWPILSAYQELIKYYKPISSLKALQYSILSAILNLNYTIITKKEITWKEIMKRSIKALKRRILPKLPQTN